MSQREFFASCFSGDAFTVDRLAASDAGLLGARDPTGKTGLHIAAEMGHESTVRALIKNGSDPTAQEPGGLKPHHLAFDCGHTTLAVYLRGMAVTPFPSAQRVRDESYSSARVASHHSTPSPSAPHRRMSSRDDGIFPGRRCSVASPPSSASLRPLPFGYDAAEIHVRISTPGRPVATLCLAAHDTFAAVPAATGLKDAEKHLIFYETHLLSLASTAGEADLPFSSRSEPIPLEQRPVSIFLLVVDPSGASHPVKLPNDQPISKILNAPGIQEFQAYDVAVTWEGRPIDMRLTPDVYVMPCSIDNPVVLNMRIQHT
ncbi:hypothetical protein DIPPA_34185 [Diplonema papillatum]|nr:hypothetical protein DIPPA_34185 [Diplonema papillatum]